MKKKQVDAILVDQAKRKARIVSFICLIIIISFISLSFFFLFLKNNKTYYVPYTEESNIKYKVYLKENDFFKDEYLDMNREYIASLIDKIDAKFDYELNVEEKKIDYRYQYYIEAEVIVKDKNTKNIIYNFKDTMVDKQIFFSNKKSNVKISKNISIDYNKYNELIKKFVNVYNLDDSISTLNVNMYVKVLGDCENIEKSDKNSIFSLNIPLTTKTVDIDFTTNLIDSGKENFMACKDSSPIIYLFLVISVIVFIINIPIVIKLIKYIIITRSAETIYHRELKKILNNYKSYIQKINNTFELKGYQPLEVDTFTDMLEIRDTLSQPILMVENKEKTGVFFIIPSNTKILYLYSLKISDIKKQMKQNSINKGIMEEIDF